MQNSMAAMTVKPGDPGHLKNKKNPGGDWHPAWG